MSLCDNYLETHREAICESLDPDLFAELNIPGSTIRSWLFRQQADPSVERKPLLVELAPCPTAA